MTTAGSGRSTLVTAASLGAELSTLGVAPGDVIMVHSSLRALGHVVGGAQAVLDALRRAVGESGTLVMPVQSWQLSDPAFLEDPDVPEEWWPVIREHLPAFDPVRTPSRTMGAVAELFRTEPGTLRSPHPHRSIAANGRRAEQIVAVHDLDCPAGERSPLAALYELDARILLLGVGADKATALHLAEHRADHPGKRRVANGGPVMVDGDRHWLRWEELWVEDHDFAEVTDAFCEQSSQARRGGTGAARSALLPMRPLVDFAAGWLSSHR